MPRPRASHPGVPLFVMSPLKTSTPSNISCAASTASGGALILPDCYRMGVVA